jgi:hypothetical protein
MAEFVPPQASEDVPWDRPAKVTWPEPELDAMTWNERWNEAAYDPDYPLPPVVGRAPARQAVAAATGGSAALRFGRPVGPPDDFESDDPYDEYAPVADDLDAPGQLTWTGGTVPFRPAASADAPVPPWPAPGQPPTPRARPAVEPPTWSPTSRSVFGDYFASSGSKAAPPLASPARDAVPPPPERAPQPAPPAAEEWPPIPTDFQPQWASVAPVQPAWPHGPLPLHQATGGAAAVTPGQLAWVQSTPPAVSVERPPAPPRSAAPSKPLASYIVAPPIIRATASAGGAAATLPSASLPGVSPLPAVRPVIPPRIAPRPPAPILPDDFDDPAANAGQDLGDAESEGSGPSTLSTLFWMTVTGVVVVGLVLAFLHFMTGVFR